MPVAVGGPDGSVAVIGSGAIRIGQTVDVAGTTDVILQVVDRLVIDPTGRSVVNAFLLADRWTIGGPTGLTGGAVAWLSGALGHDSVSATYAALGSAIDTIAPGADGVAFRTGLTGERYPTWAADRAGRIDGLRPEHGPATVLRAAEEGAAFAVREAIEALEGIGGPIDEVVVVGGISRRPSALQLRADAWQRRVVAPAAPEATTMGVAILSSVVAGAHADAASAAAAMTRPGTTYDPDRAATPAWEAAFARWGDAGAGR